MHILDIKAEILENVLNHIEDPRCMLSFRQANSTCKAIVDSNMLWRTAYKSRFDSYRQQTVPSSSHTASENSSTEWQELYRRHHVRERHWRGGARSAQHLDSVHHGWLTCVRARPEPDPLVAVGSMDGAISLWGPSADAPATYELQQLLSCKQQLAVLQLDLGASLLASSHTGQLDECAIVRHLLTGQRVATVKPPVGGRWPSACAGLQLMVGERTLLVALDNGTVLLHDLRSQAAALQLHVLSAIQPSHEPPPAVLSACAQPGLPYVAASSNQGHLLTSDMRAPHLPPFSQIQAAASSPIISCSLQYPLLAAGTVSFLSSTVQLWDIARNTGTGMPAEVLKPERAGSEVVTSVCLSPDWRLASANLDGAVKLWDVGAVASPGGSRRPQGLPLGQNDPSEGPLGAPTTLQPLWEVHPSLEGDESLLSVEPGSPPHLRAVPVSAIHMTESMLATAGDDSRLHLFFFDE